MTELYNKYCNEISNDECYISEIAFVNTNDTFIANNCAFIEYVENNKSKQGIFKTTDELVNIYINYRKNSNYKHKIIKKIKIVEHYHSYIKIIKDKKNPQLEGKIMRFKFGRKMCNIIYNYLIDNNYSSLNNTFIVSNYKKNMFIVIDNCHFTNIKYKIEDYNLDIRNEIITKKINILNIERKEKLYKLDKL